MSTQPVERTLNSNLFGQEVSFDYSETWVGYSMLGLRLVMAWIFLQAGLEKLFDGGIGDPFAWSAAGFLEHAVAEANPLHGVFVAFAEYTAFVDPLVIIGQLAIGLALLFGVAVRFAALMGGIQMFFFWTASWEGGVLAGLPVEHGYVITSEFVYILILFGLGAWGAGRILGLDARLEQHAFVQNRPWLRYFLG